jgi:hypothetical protein
MLTKGPKMSLDLMLTLYTRESLGARYERVHLDLFDHFFSFDLRDQFENLLILFLNSFI